jgi:rhodanese-related sulfurtransferase
MLPEVRRLRLTYYTPRGYKKGMQELLARPTTWIVAALALALVAVLVAVSWPRPSAAAAGRLSNVTVQDLHAAAAAGALVLDVREPFEFEAGHVAGSVLVPLATVGVRAGEFDKEQPVYVFCRSGNRSLAAAQTLVDAGYRDVRNVQGGIIAWQAAGLPVSR